MGKEFYKVIPHDEGSALPTAAQLNCTFGILQREILGLVNLGEGGLKFSADNVRMFLVVPMQPSEELERVFLNLATRIQKTVLDEIRQPDRRALDEVVFEVLGLTAGEREAVYEAVVALVRARLDKAQSLKNVTLQPESFPTRVKGSPGG